MGWLPEFSEISRLITLKINIVVVRWRKIIVNPQMYIVRMLVGIFGFVNILGSLWFSFSIDGIFVFVALVLGVSELTVAWTAGKLTWNVGIIIIFCIILVLTVSYLAFGHSYGTDWFVISARAVELLLLSYLYKILKGTSTIAR